MKNFLRPTRSKILLWIFLLSPVVFDRFIPFWGDNFFISILKAILFIPSIPYVPLGLFFFVIGFVIQGIPYFFVITALIPYSYIASCFLIVKRDAIKLFFVRCSHHLFTHKLLYTFILSFFLNLLLIGILCLYIFTPFLDFLVAMVSLPRMCDFINQHPSAYANQKVQEDSIAFCNLVHKMIVR